MPVFEINAREIPINTKEILRFSDETSRIQTAKNGRQLGFKWRLVFSSLFSEVKSHKTQVIFGVLTLFAGALSEYGHGEDIFFVILPGIQPYTKMRTWFAASTGRVPCGAGVGAAVQ